jgi:hypothetical protein
MLATKPPTREPQLLLGFAAKANGRMQVTGNSDAALGLRRVEILWVMNKIKRT